MAIVLTVSKTDRGQRSEGSGHNETDYNYKAYLCEWKTSKHYM